MAETVNQYRVWSQTLSAEAPVELPALVTAIKRNQVRADTWVYLDHQGAWIQAGHIPELQMFFHSSNAAKGERSGVASMPDGSKASLKPGVLRRNKLFADLQDEQVAKFIEIVEVINFKQFAKVVSAGDPSDAMYLVLEGELRARNMVGGKETILATIGVGDFFGELSLLDHGPRSADIVANQPSSLLKISAGAFEQLLREHPAVAAPFLHALSRAIAGRLRGLTKRYQDSIHISRVASAVS